MRALAPLAFALVLGIAACGSDDSKAVTPAAIGGPVTGAADAHCADKPIGTIDPAKCTSAASGDDGDDGDDASVGAAGAGGADCNLAHDSAYGDTNYGTEADDDDCKYHVAFTATPISDGQAATFTVTATKKGDGTPLTGNALSRVELYVPCDSTHLEPDSDVHATITESPAGSGVYTITPVTFDEPGRWVIRFHFFESCIDQDGSPHGHAAFFIDIP